MFLIQFPILSPQEHGSVPRSSTSDFNRTARSVQLIKDAYRTDKIVGTVARKIQITENPSFDDLHNVGTIGQIVKLLEMPDGSTTAIIQGRKRMVLNELITDDPYLLPG